MRLFVAICLPEPAKDLLVRAQRGLERQAGRGRFPGRDELHLTLAFLGQADGLAQAIAAMEKVSAAPFSLGIRGLGCFPSPQGQTWWMGIRPCPPLEHLQRQLREQLLAQGFALEDRPFRPHVTLGRGLCLSPAFDCRVLAQQLGDVWLQVDRICLMESIRHADRPHYEERYCRPLRTDL